MPTIADIMGCFESLGDNCELGIAQRFVGLEPLGLFRLSFCKLPSLLRALANDFADIDGPEPLELLIEPDREYLGRVRGYDFKYHTEKFVGQVAPEALLAQQVTVVRFLARKLRDDMSAAEKIFVRKGQDSQNLEDIEALYAALRRRGPITLLWMVREDREHRTGTVEVLRDGLLKAYIDRFASTGAVHTLSAAWYDVCRNAYALWRGACVPGSVIAHTGAAVASNLVRRSATFEGFGWRAAAVAACTPDTTVPPLCPDVRVLRHRLRETTGPVNQNVHFHYVPEGLLSEELYVGSIHVWLPRQLPFTVVAAVFEGFATVRMHEAELAKRGQWQRVWVAARIPAGACVANLALKLLAPKGSWIASTAWQLERGSMPSRYVPSDARPLATSPLTSAAG